MVAVQRNQDGHLEETQVWVMGTEPKPTYIYLAHPPNTHGWTRRNNFFFKHMLASKAHEADADAEIDPDHMDDKIKSRFAKRNLVKKQKEHAKAPKSKLYRVDAKPKGEGRMSWQNKYGNDRPDANSAIDLSEIDLNFVANKFLTALQGADFGEGEFGQAQGIRIDLGKPCVRYIDKAMLKSRESTNFPGAEDDDDSTSSEDDAGPTKFYSYVVVQAQFKKGENGTQYFSVFHLDYENMTEFG